MRKSKIRIALTVILLSISSALLLWSYWPARREIRIQPISPSESTLPESRRLTLAFSPQIRVGEGDVIRLTLDVDAPGSLAPTANLYETHNVIAEARLDLAGVEVKPSDLISEPLLPGQSVTFYWSIRPQAVGVVRGTAWLYLRFVDKLSGQESRKTVSAHTVEIDALNFLGLPLGLVRWLGGIGLIVGAIVGFPFLEDVVKFLFRRRKRA